MGKSSIKKNYMVPLFQDEVGKIKEQSRKTFLYGA